MFLANVAMRDGVQLHGQIAAVGPGSECGATGEKGHAQFVGEDDERIVVHDIRSAGVRMLRNRFV